MTRESDNKTRQLYRKKYPYCRTLESIKQRCTNPNCERYPRYGGRGIKCLITKEEIKELWFRDKAYLMEKPSIDREDNDGNYTFDNCQYMEFAENTVKDRNKRVGQFDISGILIKEWDSIKSAKECLHVNNISNTICGRQKTSGGFKWKLL